MNNDTSDRISPAALKEQLRSELSKDHPDQAAVSRLLDELGQHASEDPIPAETQRKLDALWQDYKAARDSAGDTDKQKNTSRQIIIKLSAMAALLALIICITPAVAGVSSLCKLFGSWSEETFSFLPTMQPTEPRETHTFVTDHPGLQQLYDAVTQLGITEPVVPTWVPEGYQLEQLTQQNTPNGICVFALLECEDSIISLVLQPYTETGSREYSKDHTNVETLEISGIIHYILCNDQQTSALWTVNDLECALSVCGGDADIQQILLSIYKEAD